MSRSGYFQDPFITFSPKIEYEVDLVTGKMTPNNMLVSKLEHALKLTLLVPITKDKTPAAFSKSSTRELTMGDLIQFNKKDGEESTERKQS